MTGFQKVVLHILHWVGMWIALAEATVGIVTLWFYSPSWQLRYLLWTLHKARRWIRDGQKTLTDSEDPVKLKVERKCENPKEGEVDD